MRKSFMALAFGLLLVASTAAVAGSARPSQPDVWRYFMPVERQAQPDQRCDLDLARSGNKDEASATTRRWARRHQAAEAPSFRIDVRKATGEPLGPCGRPVWNRSWIGNVDWRYTPGSGLNQSASMSTSTIFVGHDRLRGWLIWMQFH
jgi:hypothetical protein